MSAEIVIQGCAARCVRRDTGIDAPSTPGFEDVETGVVASWMITPVQGSPDLGHGPLSLVVVRDLIGDDGVTAVAVADLDTSLAAACAAAGLPPAMAVRLYMLGEVPDVSTVEHCQAVGRSLARHIAHGQLPPRPRSPWELQRWRDVVRAVGAAVHLSDAAYDPPILA